jgi:serine/threonine-protein kinase
VAEERDVVTETDEVIVSAPALPLAQEQSVARETEVVRPRPDGSIETHRVTERRRSSAGVLAAVLGTLLLLLLAAAGGWWLITRDGEETVPTVVGLSVVDGAARLTDDGFDARTIRQPAAAPAGEIIRQDPTGGTRAAAGSDVELTVSTGPATATVPNAVGVTEADARDRLVAAGFEVTSRKVFAKEPAGIVVAQNPAAGSKVDPANEVTINVSKGSALTTVPDVVGQARADAEAALADAGLTANVVVVPSAQAEGTVVAQNPTGGQVRRGAAVRLNVSAGSP